MTDPTLMLAVDDASPERRSQFSVQVFTATYDLVDDLIRLNAMEEAGVWI
jgi:hypothetical protein